MIIINESSYLIKILEENQKIDSKIKFFSTKGMLFNYNIDKKNKVIIYPIINKIKQIKYIKSLKNQNKEIIIATDFDSVGELIALEILYLIPNAKRLQIPFDDLFYIQKITKKYISNNSNHLFNKKLASNYIKEKLKDLNKKENIYEKKRNLLAELIQNNIKTIFIPKTKFKGKL
jgi:DNA topoisomerase IA